MNPFSFRLIKTFLVGLFFITQPTYAEIFPFVEQVQVPACLAAHLSPSYKILAANQHFRIVEVPFTKINELAWLADQVHCGRFINLSAHFTDSSTLSKEDVASSLLDDETIPEKSISSPQVNYSIDQQATVNKLIEQVDSNQILKTLTHLTSYHNRSATTQRGAKVAEWLKGQVEDLAKLNNRDDVTTYFVKTGWYQQPSLVSVIGKDLTKPGVILGAHMDTLDGFMPGAGDDGSGSSSLMEVTRILMASGLNFDAPIYLIWYAAEERGLVGSQYVVDHFKKKKIPVKGVVQFDMTGYRNVADDPTMWVFKDYTDKALTQFTADLIKTYVKVPVAYSRCGYGCSDHASWHKIGIPAAFPCETSFEEHNPYIHTSSDTMDRLNSDHMANFAKLGLAFAVELASK